MRYKYWEMWEYFYTIRFLIFCRHFLGVSSVVTLKQTSLRPKNAILFTEMHCGR